MTTEAMQLVPVNVYCFITNGGDGSYHINWRLTEEAANEAIDNEEIDGDGDGRWRVEVVQTYVGSNVWKEANDKEVKQKVEMWFESFRNPDYQTYDPVEDIYGNKWSSCSYWNYSNLPTGARLFYEDGNGKHIVMTPEEFFAYPFIPHPNSRKAAQTEK